MEMLRIALKLLALFTIFVSVNTSVSLAETTTGDLIVSATVADTCTLTATTTLDFGTVTASTTTSEDTAGELEILCTGAHIGVTVTMDGGDNPSGGQRYLSDGGSNTIAYSIHSDSGHTSAVAIDGTIFTGNISANVAQPVPVYGQIPSGSYNAGSYGDTITATLTY
jgi:spore coat protein U-like protein